MGDWIERNCFDELIGTRIISTDIDTISGASASCRAIKEAVKDALTKVDETAKS